MNLALDDSIVAKADLSEAVVLESLKRGNLATWIFENADHRVDSVEFMNAVCSILHDLQTKGVITGFRAAYLAGANALPIVSNVRLAA
jgi:hypothetical protein